MGWGRQQLADNALTPRVEIKAELDKREKLIWADSPRSIKSHALSHLAQAVFGIPFTAFAIFWMWAASGFGSNGNFDQAFDFFFLFGVPFVLVGLGMLLSPIWFAIKGRGQIYAVTDKRLIIRDSFPSVKVRSWPLSQLGQISRTGEANGIGNVFFAEEHKQGKKGRSFTTKVGFLGVSNPKKLEETLRAALEEGA